MASGSKVPMKKQYKSSKLLRESDFDSNRFVSTAAFKVYSEILPQENITDCYFFNFRILKQVNTGHKLVGIDKLIVYRVLNDDKVNFASIVQNWMKAKCDAFCSKHYASRSRKAMMLFGSILTVIFRHYDVDLSEEVSVLMPRGHEICDLSLKMTRFQRACMPTPSERVTRKGSEILTELRTCTFVRHPKIKAKRKVNVEENEENGLVARIRGLEIAQLEIQDEVCSHRMEVRDEIHSVKTLLEHFIRFSHPSFLFPTSHFDHPS
ncbi:hypothetical protein OROHE_007866 [Orobanche hederae]